MIIEVDHCLFDDEQLSLSHGLDQLDAIGKEAFVNHIHFDGEDFESTAKEQIVKWTQDMKLNWPGRTFKIYFQKTKHEATVRFHLVRDNEADWCQPCAELEITEVRA